MGGRSSRVADSGASPSDNDQAQAEQQHIGETNSSDAKYGATDGSERKASDTANEQALKKSAHLSGSEKSISDGNPHSYDPDFHGPIKQRSCTDVICLLIFLCFIGGWCFIGMLAYKYGDTDSLLMPTDSLGRKCGSDKGLERYPYLHFFDISRCANPLVFVSGCPTQQVCVAKCPQKSFVVSQYAALENLCDESARSRFFCRPGVNASQLSVDGSQFARSCKSLLQNDCAPYTIASKPIFGRCMPLIGLNQTQEGIVLDENNEIIHQLHIDTLTDAVHKLNVFLSVQGFGESVWKDYQSAQWVIVTALLASMVVSLIWILLMRWFTGVLVWTSLFGSLAAITYGCVYTYMRYDSLKKAGAEDQPITMKVLTSDAGSLLQMKSTWLVLFIILCVLGGVMLLLVLILFKRLRIAIQVIEEASKAVTSTLFSLFYPIVPWTLQLITIALFVVMALNIASMSTKEYKVSELPANCSDVCPAYKMNDTCHPDDFNRTCLENCPSASCTFYAYRKYKSVKYLQLYNLFALLWMMFFASAFGEMVLAGAFAAWYFTFDKANNLSSCPLLGSTHRTVRFHLGTLAFGSLIIAIVRLIRIVLDYIEKKCRQYPGSEVVRCVLCVCKCCMWCMEVFMKFINRNAYIMCAIYGKNFCTSAKDAFSLLMRNALRVLAVNSVCDFVLFLGKLLVTVTVTVGSFYFLDNRIDGLDTYVPETENNWLMVLTIAVGCYFIASLFFSVYGMAVDTIFLCFLEDIERNDGSAERPYYMSKNLMQLLGKRNKSISVSKSSLSLDE